MIHQFVPDVSDSDVERVITRDWPAEEHEAIRAMIGQVKVRETPRVILACLKTSNGDTQRLKRNLADAPGYYREIIGDAEYPNYMRKVFRIDKLTDAEQLALIEKDKKQYLNWLYGPTT